MLNLSPDEIYHITKKRKFTAQIKALRQLGIPVKPRPDGSPLVARTAYLIAMGVPESDTKDHIPEPDYEAISA